MKILVLIEGDNEVCCRYRIEAFREALAEREISYEVVRFEKGLIERIGNLHKAKSADAVIVQRKLLPLWQTLLLRKWSRRLIYDVDDAVYQRDSNSSKGPKSRIRSSKYRAIVSRADAIITGNEHLRQVTSAWTEPERVFVTPTCIDTRKYHLAGHQRIGLEARLVWIGQKCTLQTLLKARVELAAIAQRMPGIEFHQICSCTADIPGLRVILRPWSQATETADLADCDIGMAWMPNDSWSLGKCGLKVLQYMAAGLPVIANPVGIHKELVIHGETGLLASTPRQWAEAVASLAHNPPLRKKMGAAGREMVEKRYSVNVWQDRFVDLVQTTTGFNQQ